jgi:predicted HD phosphohydrolase
VSRAATGLSVDEILGVVAAGSEQRLDPGAGVSLLEHALQTAALLARRHRGDGELAAAGLVHDIVRLLPGGTDKTHAAAAAGAVRGTLGERVAAIVALHVEAKRYLVAAEAGYAGVLGADSVVSLGRQGGALSAAGMAAFRARPWAADALALRRADDAGKVEDLEVGELADWVPLLRELAGEPGA